MLQVRILVTLILCYGIHHVSSNTLFVSHRGQDEDHCGNWTLPCRSVRYAVKISSAHDVIQIDYAEGRPYKECEHLISKENHTIMVDKSLSFYGFNGTAMLHCEQTYSFFRINSSKYTTPKIAFTNLLLATRGIVLETIFQIPTKFEVEFNFCDIERSSYFVSAISLSCSIQVLNSSIRSDAAPLSANCNNLTARLTGSTFLSCSVLLQSEQLLWQSQEAALNVHIFNCSFIRSKRQKYGYSLVHILHQHSCNIAIKSSTFVNLYDIMAMPEITNALLIFSFPTDMIKTNIVLDGLRFENFNCDPAVVSFVLSGGQGQPNVGIFNSVFVNTTRALYISIIRRRSLPFSNYSVNLHNNTFNITHTTFGNEGPVYLFGGSYNFSSCRFFQHVPVYNPAFPLIHAEASVWIKFENCWYENDLITETSRNGNLSNTNMFYVISLSHSYVESFTMEGYFTILCPQGYTMNLLATCDKLSSMAVSCHLFTALCVQCPRKTYSLDRGEVRNTRSNYIVCHDCPVGGNCVEGQVTSKPNFWGYESNRTVTFLQCPPKYCCDTNRCKHYNSCHGNRMGILCGKCPSGMSESLFDTKCKPNKDCTSVTFWPGVSVYLITYLLFFLYQENILNFVLTRIIPRFVLSSRNGRNLKPGGLLKILFYYYQVVHLLSNSIGSDVTVQLFDDIEKVFNFLIVSILSYDCPFQDLRPAQKAVIVHSVGYSLLTLLCLLYLSIFVFKIVKKLRSRSTQQTVAVTETMDHSPNLKENRFLGRIAGAFANISLLTYASSAQLCLSLLHCVPLDDSQVLFLDGNVKCYQTFQYFLLAYMISSILPFCLVPVLGSYLLKLNRISVAQFCLACIFPLPFCCYWSYLLVRNSSWWMRHSCRVNTNDRIQDDITNENSTDSTTIEGSGTVSGNSSPESENMSTETVLRGSKSAVLRVLLGPFRPHKARFIFPASHLPWEGFLILRRLAVILVLTFVYDTRVKATLSMILCVAILLSHVFVKPFKTTGHNVLETLSLGALIIISALSLVKSIYYGEDLDSGSKSLLNMINVIENVFIISPVALILSLVMLSILFKLVVVFRLCFQAIFRQLKLFQQTNQSPCENCTPEEQQSLLSS